MGKGDGKKRRKKKSATTISTPQQQPQQPLPQRVSTDINIPVRRQIRYAQMHKQAAKQSGASFRQTKVVRTKYRRTWGKHLFYNLFASVSVCALLRFALINLITFLLLYYVDEEEIEEKREERKKRGQDPDWDVILNQTAASPLLICDGYNIIHKWSRLKKHMIKGDPQRARTLLVDDLENLKSIKGWRIEVVFDGTGKSTTGPLGSGGPGSSRITRTHQEAKKSVSKHGVRTVFTGVGIEADSYIQERCAKAKNVTNGELTGSFIVATDDAMIRLAGQSAGAYCMSAGRFVDELKSVKKAVDYRVEAAVAKANGQAVRPEKLRGTHFHSFGRNSVLIEDKRNRKKKMNDEETIMEDDDLNIEIDEDENGIPWWAKVPDQKPQRRL